MEASVHSVGMFTGMEGKLKKKGVKAKEASAQRLYDKDGYRRRVDCLLFRNLKKQEVSDANCKAESMYMYFFSNRSCWYLAGIILIFGLLLAVA